ncbi:MAG: CCA tRNA nucleotidyltransferase [Candidatus Eiseniibacteriota bacterium]
MARNPLVAARHVAKELRADGHEAFLAGGAVRDRLLGLEPHDVDVATSARPEQIMARFPESRLVGAAFGVVRVHQGEDEIEVATFRSEGPYLDGRRPSSVRFATAEEDVRRRDFTVNGLLMDPETLEVLDRVGGRADLETRTLRAIGDPRDRFREDHLRLLRAVRLAAQLDFAVEPGTKAAVVELAPLAREVAAERTRDELLRLLTGPAPARGLELLHECGLLRVVLPDIAALEGVPQPPEFHPEGDVLTHTVLLLRHLRSASPTLALGALLHDVGKPATFVRGPDRIRFPDHARVGAEMADGICRELRLSNESRERVVDLVAQHMRFLDAQKMKTSTLKRFLRMPYFDEHLELHRADCLASHGKLDNWEFVCWRLAEYGGEELRPARLLGGGDLLALGYQEGPAVGAELRALEELQLAGEITTREEALARARRDLVKLRST